MEIKMKWWGKQNTVVNYRTKRTKQKSHIASKKKTETWDFRNKVWSSIQQSKKQIIHRSRQIGMFTQAHNLINSKLTRERFNEKKTIRKREFSPNFPYKFFSLGKTNVPDSYFLCENLSGIINRMLAIIKSGDTVLMMMDWSENTMEKKKKSNENETLEICLEIYEMEMTKRFSLSSISAHIG